MSVKLTDPIDCGIYRRESGTTRDVDYYIASRGIQDEIGFGHPRIKGDCFYIVRHWYTGSRNLFDKLESSLKWNELHLQMYGKVHKMKRLVHVMSDYANNNSLSIPYGGFGVPTPWSSECQIIKNRLNQELGIECDTAILNLYKTGDDFIPYHSDRADIGYPNLVATVSLGGTRRFYLKNIENGSIIKTQLESGDLVIMSGDIQKKYKHSIPKQKNVQPRISITVRE